MRLRSKRAALARISGKGGLLCGSSSLFALLVFMAMAILRLVYKARGEKTVQRKFVWICY